MGGWPWAGRLQGRGQGTPWERVSLTVCTSALSCGLRRIASAPEWPLWVWSPSLAQPGVSRGEKMVLRFSVATPALVLWAPSLSP